MTTKILILTAAFTVALSGRATANDILYQTGFEAPTFSTALPFRGQDGWANSTTRPEELFTVSTENPRTGVQALRWKGVSQSFGASGSTAWRFIGDDISANPTLLFNLHADVRLDGPRTGTLGTPEQDVLSANLMAGVLLPNGFAQIIGGFFLSSNGKIWTFGSRLEDNYRYSTAANLGSYHSLDLRVDFLARQLSYFVDGVELGSAPIAVAVKSEIVASAYLQVFGYDAPIDTPELSYNRNNYTAYFDNYSIEAIPLTPADVVISFATTDYAASETDGTASVRVVRRGYADSAVSAAFSTADDSATAGSDYRSVSTTVNFASGEMEKFVPVPLLDDELVEVDEVITLHLDSVTSGVHLPRPTAPLWILDNERAGSADPNFKFNAGALGLVDIFNATSIVPLPGGKFLAFISGISNEVDYVTFVARFLADGSVDSSFDFLPLPELGLPSQVTAINNGSRVLVNEIDHLTRLDAKGKKESSASFNVVTTLGADPGFITDVVVQPDQKIIIVGLFDAVNGIPRPNVARIFPNGKLDATFDPGAGTDDAVIDAALQPDGRIVIAGYFQNAGGQSHPFIAHLNANGSVDPTLETGVGFGDAFPAINTVLVQPDGRILVGGGFENFQGVPRSSLMRLLPNGSLDTTFDVGTGFISSFGSPGYITALALQDDGKILVAGGFAYYNETWATGVVRLNSDGSLDTSFQLGGNDSFAANINAGPSIPLLPDGSMLVFLRNNVSFIKDEPVQYNGIVRLNGDLSKSKK